MRAHDFFNEDLFGTEPKRSARAGSRPSRGHNSEPRYKSAPVVPGGDNPDAVHVPIKGDEPVQRGDQVVVQDPDNIATVFTGTVKRIGREHVYVTLKNGETIAAPHDEVSKSYEVLSKRAHNILNKKGPSRSNYKVDEETLDEGKGYDTVNTLVGTYNASVGGDQFSPLYVKSPGTRVWTRGDGVRHRDPGRIQYENDVAAKKWPKAMSQFWQWLTTQPGVKSIGQVSGEFGTSAMMNAVRLGSLYFALTQYNTIVWGSVSRFKNPRSVWRHKAPEQGVAETKKLTSREKFVKGLKRGGYDVEERSKYWDAKVKELEQQRDEYEKELASRKQSNVGEMASPGAVANKVTRVQGKEYLVHSLPADMSKVKLVTDDSGKQVYIWVEKAGMRPQYTYYWFAPAQPVQESMCAKHISPSGAETTMCPNDDDYEINYGKNSGIDDFRKKNGLDVRTGKKVKEECAGVGIVTKQNSTADVGPGTIKKNLKAFSLEEVLAELGVDKTFKFAKKAHGDQMYGDQPYWTHPRAVAAAGKRFFGAKFNNDAIKVAFLHDVVEDTPYKLEQLKNMGLSPEVIEAVGLLTKNKALSYEQNIKNIIASGNRLAMMVKYADNFKNYTGDKSSWDPKRAAKSQQKYQASLNMLGNKLGVDKHSQHADRDAHVADMEQELEEWKASRQLCRSSTPDSDLGASALSSCKSQGLRARDGNKSHKLGKSPKSRTKMGGHRIKGKKYGGPLPDWS